MRRLSSLCVFCGSNTGFSLRHAAAATEMGTALARAGINLVYGGGHIGLMGIIADAVLAAGGKVDGVIPKALVERELAHGGLTCLHVVDSMHERKAKMAALADGFVALPGGAGTLEEIFEQWTWVQLGIHAKPCGFLTVDRYFDPIETMIRRMVAEGFLSTAHADLLFFERDVTELLSRIEARLEPLPPAA